MAVKTAIVGGTVNMGNYRALSQKIMASVMAGAPPAMAQAYETWTSQLVRGGVLVPLDSLMDSDPLYSSDDWNDFFGVFRENNTYNGRIYSFPFNKSVPLIYYNVELYRQLGLEPAGTWAQQRLLLKALCLDVNGDGDLLDEGDRWGTAFGPSVWTFECLLAQAGGSLLNEEGTGAAFNGPGGAEALGFLTDLLYVDRTAYLSSGYDHQRDFLDGGIGQNVSAIAREYNNSVMTRIRAEEQIYQNAGLGRFFFGGDTEAAGTILADLNTSREQVREMRSLVENCTCDNETRALLMEQIMVMEQEQERLMTLAEGEISDKGLFGWIWK